jgi:hypothetical protein
MDDAAFREQFKLVYVPSSFKEAGKLQDKVVFARAEINEGAPDAVSHKLEELEPIVPNKEVIANIHRMLAIEPSIWLKSLFYNLLVFTLQPANKEFSI